MTSEKKKEKDSASPSVQEELEGLLTPITDKVFYDSSSDGIYQTELLLDCSRDLERKLAYACRLLEALPITRCGGDGCPYCDIRAALPRLKEGL